MSLAGPAARSWRLALALCGVIVAADQGAKAAIESELVPGQRVDVFPGLDFTNVHNEGIAFGLAPGGGALLVLLTLAALGLILVLFARNSTLPGIWIAMGMLAGGAFGNLADRIRIDAVTDFIELPFWPAFNLADVAIVLGVAGLALVFMEHHEEEDQRE